MKNNIKKTILTLIAIITLMSTVAVLPTYAALPDTGGTVEPRWDNTDIINISLSFKNDGYGYSECVVVGENGVTKIVIEIVVYKQVGIAWLPVAHKKETIANYVGGLSCQFSPISGITYKSTYKVTVTKNGIDEIIEKSKVSTCE